MALLGKCRDNLRLKTKYPVLLNYFSKLNYCIAIQAATCLAIAILIMSSLLVSAREFFVALHQRRAKLRMSLFRVLHLDPYFYRDFCCFQLHQVNHLAIEMLNRFDLKIDLMFLK